MDKKGKIALITAVTAAVVLALSFVMAAQECNDGIDNDGDGAVDLADGGCSNKGDKDESNCGDGVCEGGESSSTCSADCGVPQTCGNDIVEGTEVCDGTDLNGGSCQSEGFDDGSLGCNSNCDAYDTSSCYNYVCGNNVIEGSEVCDGTDLGGETCSSQGFDGGSLGCDGGCGALDTSGCYDNTCSDTDGGILANVTGTTSGDFEGSAYSNTDSCVDADNVLEYYCNTNLEASQQVNCGTDFYGSNYCNTGDVYRDFTDYGCATGACGSTVTPELVESCEFGCTAGSCDPAPDSCSDSDGDNPFVQGIVSGDNGGSPYSYTDSCGNGTALNEWVCSGTAPTTNFYDCSWYAGNLTGICVSGACV